MHATTHHYAYCVPIPQVNLDEAALSQADGLSSSAAAVVLGSLCDAMATKAVSSWLDTARDWASFAITMFNANSGKN